jgi:hypothetical protein
MAFAANECPLCTGTLSNSAGYYGCAACKIKYRQAQSGEQSHDTLAAEIRELRQAFYREFGHPPDSRLERELASERVKRERREQALILLACDGANPPAYPAFRGDTLMDAGYLAIEDSDQVVSRAEAVEGDYDLVVTEKGREFMDRELRDALAPLDAGEPEPTSVSNSATDANAHASKLVEFDAWLSFRPEFNEVLTAFRSAFGTDTSARSLDQARALASPVGERKPGECGVMVCHRPATQVSRGDVDQYRCDECARHCVERHGWEFEPVEVEQDEQPISLDEKRWEGLDDRQRRVVQAIRAGSDCGLCGDLGAVDWRGAGVPCLQCGRAGRVEHASDAVAWAFDAEGVEVRFGEQFASARLPASIRASIVALWSRPVDREALIGRVEEFLIGEGLQHDGRPLEQQPELTFEIAERAVDALAGVVPSGLVLSVEWFKARHLEWAQGKHDAALGFNDWLDRQVAEAVDATSPSGLSAEPSVEAMEAAAFVVAMRRVGPGGDAEPNQADRDFALSVIRPAYRVDAQPEREDFSDDEAGWAKTLAQAVLDRDEARGDAAQLREALQLQAEVSDRYRAAMEEARAEVARLRAAMPLSTDLLRKLPHELEVAAKEAIEAAYGEGHRSFGLALAALNAIADYVEQHSPPSSFAGARVELGDGVDWSEMHGDQRFARSQSGGDLRARQAKAVEDVFAEYDVRDSEGDAIDSRNDAFQDRVAFAVVDAVNAMAEVDKMPPPSLGEQGDDGRDCEFKLFFGSESWPGAGWVVPNGMPGEVNLIVPIEGKTPPLAQPPWPGIDTPHVAVTFVVADLLAALRVPSPAVGLTVEEREAVIRGDHTPGCHKARGKPKSDLLCTCGLDDGRSKLAAVSEGPDTNGGDDGDQ